MSRLFRPKTILTTLGAAALAATLSRPAYAGPPEGPHRGGKLERFCQKASCTERQKQEIRNVMKEFRTDARSDRQKIRELQKKLATEFAKDKPNEKLMHSVYKQIDRIHASIVDRRHDMLMEVHGVLTPEQRKLAAKLLLKGSKHKKGKHKGQRKDGRDKSKDRKSK